MATKKTKSETIDPDKILQTIFAATIGRRREIDIEIRELPRLGDTDSDDYDHRQHSHDYQRLATERSRCEWMRYSLDVIAGQSLDSAGRKRWSRAVLTLEDFGLVEIRGIRGADIRLSRKGKKHLKEISTNAKKQN